MRMLRGFLTSTAKLLRNYHFWSIAAIFVIIAVFHYPEQLLSSVWPDAAISLGLAQHSERLFLLLPVIYAAFIFGLKGGITSLTISFIIMLPRLMLDRGSLLEPLFESLGVFVIGGLATMWFHQRQRTIAEQKSAAEALRESERNSRELFQIAPNPIWVHDMDGNITDANEATSKLVGYPLEELHRANVRLFLSPEGLNQAREVKLRLLQNQPVTTPYEQEIIRRDGTKATCMLATSLIVTDGVPKAFQTIAADITEEKRLYENLRYYLQEITRAQEEERKRIARELHDSTAQNLIALLRRMEDFLYEKAKLPVREAMVIWGFHEQIRDVLQEVRRFSRDLRPSILDDLGLLPALEWLTGELRQEYGIQTSLKIIGPEKRLYPEAELMLFRIVQEALRNITKHAEANSAEVTVEFIDSKVKVTVTDDGIGFKPPENLGDLPQMGKLGLKGMQERAQLLGGTLKLKSAPSQGTTVTVEAPV
jgi:two-component system sensor histidine kinase DegS